MRATAFLFCIIIGLSGCRKDNLGNPGIIIDVEKEFYLDFREKLTPQGHILELLISTIEVKECLNYSLDYAFNQLPGKLVTVIRDIRPPENCIPGFAPVEAFIQTNQLQTGLYSLEVNLNETIINKGSLSITTDKYNWQFFTFYGFEPLHTTLYRMPENTIWGYAGFDQSHSQAASQFLIDLKSIAEEVEYPDGYYSYFSLNGGSVTLIQNPQKDNFYSFVLKYDGVESELSALLNSYRATYGQSLELRIFTEKGKTL